MKCKYQKRYIKKGILWRIQKANLFLSFSLKKSIKRAKKLLHYFSLFYVIYSSQKNREGGHWGRKITVERGRPPHYQCATKISR